MTTEGIPYPWRINVWLFIDRYSKWSFSGGKVGALTSTALFSKSTLYIQHACFVGHDSLLVHGSLDSSLMWT